MCLEELRTLLARHAMGEDLLTKESDVAEAVWRAAHDTTGQLRFPAGPDAVRLAQAK
ncbi:hypothetical protein OOK52_32585 [Streptomyces sp. NBC_01565]|nr:hypothetical protein [Streptomyces sp. NBC_01551]MCX4545333.1 hypothetical protein [Streptomyces sp. NBC_01565]